MENLTSKYDPIRTWLQNIKRNRVSTSFSAIESILGFKLKSSATTYAAWWANEKEPTRHVQCRSWLDAGFEVRDLNLVKQTLAFEPIIPS
jgi:hypothetical protein